jgi:hypothetical protein
MATNLAKKTKMKDNTLEHLFDFAPHLLNRQAYGK